MKLLIVDDEPMNLVVGKSIFRSYGMEVTTVLSGQESIDICREKTFDIIFMDHMMSGMDGVEAMKKIRADVSGKNGEIPIVALTANAMSSAKQMFLAEGFDGFVSKPIEVEELERVMRQVLPKASITYEEISSEEEKSSGFEKMRKPETEESRQKSFPEQLRSLGIDTAEGLKYCMGDMEFYQSLLRQFASEEKEKSPLMGRYYESSDWYNYEILVHALKSTAKMIGAMDLSDKAKALEMAAKEKREEFIRENHYEMMSCYSDLAKGLREILPEEKAEDEVLEFVPDDENGEGVDEK